MGGSGGTFSGKGRSPQELASTLQKESQASAAEFKTALATQLNQLLAQFNARDSQETQQHLSEIKGVLGDSIKSTFDTLFGGSVAKHTYVDGISDIDSLLIVSGDLAKETPSRILLRLTEVLAQRLSGVESVIPGRIAVTITYPGGKQIQLVPCIQDGEKLRVPAWDGRGWSAIDPKQFTDGLTKRNAECNGLVIPTLKLAKAINATLPEAAQLTGYHIESLGVAAFRGYAEEKTTVSMLPYFFKRASELVLTPMTDRTGQSVHVDGHLGEERSQARIALSHTLARIHQRMINASAAKSKERWMDLLGE